MSKQTKITKSCKWLKFQAWNSCGTWSMWFRVLGYGASITNSRPLFSERNGLRKRCFRIFGVKFEVLS